MKTTPTSYPHLPLTPEEAAQRRRETRKRNYNNTRARTTAPTQEIQEGVKKEITSHLFQARTIKAREAKWVRILADMKRQTRRADPAHQEKLKEIRRLLEILSQTGLTPSQLAQKINKNTNSNNIPLPPPSILSQLPRPILAAGHHWTLWVRDTCGYGVKETKEWGAKKAHLIKTIETEIKYLEAAIAHGRQELEKDLGHAKARLKEVETLTPDQGVPRR